jgi:2-dehydropantoate 2-reductase
MKVAVMGAGGIGGYVGGRLEQAGMDVTLIARGAHLQALQASGLVIETPEGRQPVPGLRAVATPDEAGPVDMVLFTVKLADADAAAAGLGPLLGPDTRVVTLQNGIDSQAILERHIGPGRVVAGIIYLAAYIQSPGVIWHPGGVHRMVLPQIAGDPVVAALTAASADLTGLEVATEADPKALVWGKFVNLAAFAGVTSIARSPIGRVYEHPATLAFYRTLMEENYAVARAEGLDFPAAQVESVLEMFRGQPYTQKSSMLVDLEAGKPIELPWLSGRMVELAARHGIAVPANEAVVAALGPFVDGAPAP